MDMATLSAELSILDSPKSVNLTKPSLSMIMFYGFKL